MPYLVDTNVLLRSIQPAHSMHGAATTAIAHLRADGAVLHVAAQNLMEFWRVATRPIAANGLGLPTAQAEVALRMTTRSCGGSPHKVSRHQRGQIHLGPHEVQRDRELRAVSVSGGDF